MGGCTTGRGRAEFLLWGEETSREGGGESSSGRGDGIWEGWEGSITSLIQLLNALYRDFIQGLPEEEDVNKVETEI